MKKIVVTFASNYINHHQLPFCMAMNSQENVDFHFIQVMPMEEKRVEMGWSVDIEQYPFVALWYEEKEKCKELILKSDVTILGWTEGVLGETEEKRLSSGKLTFRVSERIYREGQWKAISPKGLVHKYKEHIRYRNKPVYLLCAGAYVASDFALIHSYPGKMLKWGYFPDVKIQKKDFFDGKNKKIKLCWAGRLIDLKHPEYAINAAKVLCDKGYDFSLEIIGDGNKRDYIKDLIHSYGLEDKVKLLGAMKPKEVLDKMRQADVFLFTSNYLEGWGAVVNEAMGSGLCTIASYEAGSVPFLIEDGVNGITYKCGKYDDFVEKLLELFANCGKVSEISQNAQKTISEKWNAENAAKEFVRFSTEYLEGKEPKLALDGPMSKAYVIRPAGFFRTMKEKNRLE